MATGSLLMTGASRGFGRVAAERILRERPDLHLVVTARGGGQGSGQGSGQGGAQDGGQGGGQLAAELAAASGNPNVSAISCDLASLESIRAAAARLGTSLAAGNLPPLQGFVGNAGLQMTSRTTAGADGFETTFAVNVLANYLFIRLLWTEFSARSRLVIVSSDSHFGNLRHNLGIVPGPRWESVPALARPRDDAAARTVAAGRTAYSTSKLAVIYLVHALARRLPAGVDIYSFNPGLVPGTGLARDAGPVARFLFRAVLPGLIATPLALPPARAGALLADAAIGPRPGDSGSYIDRWAVTASAPESYDRGREDELWQAAAEMCGLPAEPAMA